MVYSRTKIYNSYLPENNAITSDYKSFNGAPPPGFNRIKSVPPEAKAIAKDVLSGEYGTLTPFEVGNEKFIARVEPHYHDPNSGIKPYGWHKGVTIYKSVKQNNFYKTNDLDNEAF